VGAHQQSFHVIRYMRHYQMSTGTCYLILLSLCLINSIIAEENTLSPARASAPSSLLETEEAVRVSTVSVTNVVTGSSPAPPCGPISYVWPITFNQAGKGAVVFTLERVPTVTNTKAVFSTIFDNTLSRLLSFPQQQTVVTPTKILHDVTIGISTRSVSEGDPSATNPFIEIVLGAWSNTRSLIRRARQGAEIAAINSDTGRVQSGNSYWVSLDNNRVRVGTGVQINTNVIMDTNLVDDGVVSRGTVFQGRYVGFACWNVPITYQQVSLVSDCVVGDFGATSTCSTTCGGGTTTRQRSIVAAVSGAEYGASVCPVLTTTSPCNTFACPTDCAMGTWGAWGACSNDCTCLGCPAGMQTRSRSQSIPSQNGGAACPIAKDVRVCNTQQCSIDCQLSDWSDFGDCSQKCGGTGTHTRSRIVTRPAQFGGIDCPAGDLTDEAPCNTQSCPVDCVQTDWTDWTDCSAKCGGGTQQRGRSTTVQPNYGGIQCGVDVQEQECNKQACPVDCQVGEWTAWGTCDSDCGTGSTQRTRQVTTPASVGGTACPDLTDLSTCNTQDCPVDKLGVLIKRIRHLELQDRVNSLEESAIQQAQASVAVDVQKLASQAVATPTATPVAAISLRETVHHGVGVGAGVNTYDMARLTNSQRLHNLHPTLVAAAHPYIRPSVTQLLQSEVLVDELARFAERQGDIERRYKK